MPALAQPAHQVNDVHPTPGAEDAVNARNLLGDFHAIALGQAAGCDQYLVLALIRRQLAEHLERFLFRRADKSTGIDDQHAGLVSLVHRPVTGAHQQLGH